MTMKYIFENTKDTAFKDLSANEAKIIIDSKLNETCEGLYSGEWKSAYDQIIDIYRAYRALAPKPTPNQIDWSTFPAKYNYCDTRSDGRSWIWSSMELKPSLEVTDFPAFTRGTVAPEDSLLIRPEVV